MLELLLDKLVSIILNSIVGKSKTGKELNEIEKKFIQVLKRNICEHCLYWSLFFDIINERRENE